MKKILLVLFAFVSLNAFSQLQVKEGSFKHIPGGVIEDKEEYTDGNDFPMALIKISTENISEQERLRLVFTGNRETQILKVPKTGQMWIYLSAEAATFIDIKHPDYGTYKYYLPERLCDYCVYEMVLQYIPIAPATTNEAAKPKKTYLIVKSDQPDARVYIDDELISTQEASKAVDYGTTHTYKIECKLYHTESGTVTVNDRTLIDKKLRPNFGYINISSSPEQGAKAFVDGDYIGYTPIKTDKLESGSHKVMVMKDMYKMKEETFVVSDGQTTNATLKMSANFVNVTISTDSQSDIYVDEEYKGKGRWTGRLSDGSHIFEARKSNHRASVKSMDLVLGETNAITLDAPQPINGDIDINTSPMGATIYIDGENYGETPNYISDILIGEHELKLTKQGCAEVKKTIIIKEGETLTVNEKLQTSSTKQTADEIIVKDEGAKVFEGEILKVVEVMPEFPGGAAKMMEYIQKNMKYPMTARESDIQGSVFVNFVVEPDGSITNVTVMRGIGGGCDEEAIRIVQSMPRWKPGKQRGSAVRCSFSVPIIFKLQ